jgi:hypothetical protein
MVPVVIRSEYWANEKFSFSAKGGDGCHALADYLSENAERLPALAAGRQVVLDPPANPFIFKAVDATHRSVSKLVDRIEKTVENRIGTWPTGFIRVTLSDVDGAHLVSVGEVPGHPIDAPDRFQLLAEFRLQQK